MTAEQQAVSTGTIDTSMLVTGRAASGFTGVNELIAYQALVKDRLAVTNMPLAMAGGKLRALPQAHDDVDAGSDLQGQGRGGRAGSTSSCAISRRRACSGSNAASRVRRRRASISPAASPTSSGRRSISSPTWASC